MNEPLHLRAAIRGDDDRLKSCLEAETWIEELLRDEDFLIGDWGRAGDRGVLADTEGVVEAAAWFRTFEAARADLGFVDASVPVLVNAWVTPRLRGRGHGGRMVSTLLEICADEGHGRISLATDQNNPAVRLYTRLGFRTVGVIGSRWILIRELDA